MSNLNDFLKAFVCENSLKAVLGTWEMVKCFLPSQNKSKFSTLLVFVSQSQMFHFKKGSPKSVELSIEVARGISN